jgi:hypothetical protein
MTALPAEYDNSVALPTLIDRAATALAGARTAAEVLDARELASFAYDVAKRTVRIEKAKHAHDELIAAAHRAQADALEIEARAKHRLADEYDAAQERGEIARHGGVRKFKVGETNVDPTAADLGLRRDEMHEARLIRNAERADPGIVRRTLDETLNRGEAPTRAALRRAAEARLERSINRLQRIEESVRKLDAEKGPPLTAEERARQIAVFGTQDDRAILARIDEIIELVGEQPDPIEAVKRIPPASLYAVKTGPIRTASAWLLEFCIHFEQEARNGTDDAQ